jgi:hypothetical protein
LRAQSCLPTMLFYTAGQIRCEQQRRLLGLVMILTRMSLVGIGFAQSLTH